MPFLAAALVELSGNKLMKNKSWRTTSLGIVCVLIGLLSWHQGWLPSQSLWFNVRYVGLGPLGWIVAGWMGIHARDHRCDK